MLKHQPRSHLDSIVPNMKENISQQQQKQKIKHDACSRIHTFNKSESVLVRNFGKRTDSQWLPGIIIELFIQDKAGQ